MTLDAKMTLALRICLGVSRSKESRFHKPVPPLRSPCWKYRRQLFGSTLALHPIGFLARLQERPKRLQRLATASISEAQNGRREMSILKTTSSTLRFLGRTTFLLFWSVMATWASEPNDSLSHGTNIFAPASTPAKSIADLSVFVLAITGIIFVVVFALLVYSVVKFRRRPMDAGREPAQVYGSTQIELAWTIIPILIVVVLFLATARVIHAVDDAPEPAGALDVIAIGHQYWWEFRYPKLGIVTANELHIPVSDPDHPTPTFLQLLSADTDHSFWVPELAGKTDLIPNHPNRMWMDPQRTGVFLGQCAQYCGTQHAKMLLRVSVDGPEDFTAWVRAQQGPAVVDARSMAGKRAFESNACMNCHAVGGTPADGRFGPDLTHLMSRATIAAGAAENTHDTLRLWIQNPSAIKPGSLMPAMKLGDADLDAVVSYMETLR
jgi:cytochrome c oxidase subunit 2